MCRPMCRRSRVWARDFCMPVIVVLSLAHIIIGGVIYIGFIFNLIYSSDTLFTLTGWVLIIIVAVVEIGSAAGLWYWAWHIENRQAHSHEVPAKDHPKDIKHYSNSSQQWIYDNSNLREKNRILACKLFTLAELEMATRNFSKDSELGRGGFGTVYKGVLRDGQVVAIKRANNKRTTNVELYLNEVSILSQVNHRNLVKLLGCCSDKEEPLLVYEFISNGNLEEHLQNSRHIKYNSKLSWSCRFNIALQIAEALKYLHSHANPPIIHRDIKASNILLDDQFTAKVADFGISKLVNEGCASVSTVVKGTFGYLDPEYFMESRLTDKSDVYSYGILMLVLLTSRKAIDRTLEPGQQNLAVRSVPSIEKKRATDIMDPDLKKGFSQQDYDTVQAFAQVAMACLAKDRESRPSMSDVVEMLQNIRASKLKAKLFMQAQEPGLGRWALCNLRPMVPWKCINYKQSI